MSSQEPYEAQCDHERQYTDLAGKLRGAMMDQMLAKMGKYGSVTLSAVLRQPSFEAMEKWGDQFYGMTDNIDEEIQTRRKLDPRLSLENIARFNMGISKLIDTKKGEVVGWKAPADASNALGTLVMENMAWGFAQKYYGAIQETPSWIEHFIVVGQRIINHPKRSIAWFGPKLAMTGSNTMLAISTMNALEATEVLDKNETEALHGANDALFASAKRLQKYGIKPAIAPALGASSNVSEWLFQPRNEFVKELESTDQDGASQVGYLTSESLAIIIGTDGKFKTSHPEVIEIKNDSFKRFVGVNGYKLEELIEDKTNGEDSAICGLQLTKDGELKTMWGLDLKYFCELNECSFAYEQLRSEILTVYFDLVTPNFIHEIVDQEEEATKPPKNSPETNSGKLKRLVVARTVALEVLGDEVDKAIEEELEDEKRETIARSLKKHDVINHIRRLKPTQRASLDARQHCLEDLGIVLAEYGETYVRKHIRGGEENDSKGHKLAYTPHSKAANNAGKASVAGKRARKRSRYTAPKS